jgi:4-hydroxy-tetrahydrodipicolinate synthase
MTFGNLVTAMVTPFDGKENIDFIKTTKLVNYLINNGSDGLVIAGTTGESPTLTTEEKVALFRHVTKVVDGRVPVIAGTGSNNTRASMELTRKAQEVGVDGIMLVAPYYNRPSQEGLYQHFKAIAGVTSLPIMLYNIPGRSVVNIDVDTIVRLAEIPNIVAMKEASGNLDQMADLIERTPDEFVLYSGDDGLALPVLAIGGIGVVSVSAHIIGNEMQKMISEFKAGRVTEAARIHRTLLPVVKALFSSPSPTPIKAALQMKGIGVGSVRLPLVPLTEQERTRLATTLQSLQQINPAN